MIKTKLISKFFAEFFGTMILVLMGCGSAVIAGTDGISETELLGIAFAFGLSVIVMSYTIGHISGCHINPAVSTAMMLSGLLKPTEALAYIIAQLLGSLAGSCILFLLVSGRDGYILSASGLGQNGYGAFSPAGYDLASAFIAETIFSFIFLLVIFGTTSAKNFHTGFSGLAIGLCLMLIHLVGIPITGASVNPARSIGPALLVGGAAIQQLWLFILAPLLGSTLATFIWHGVLES